MNKRHVINTYISRPTSDGDGVKLRRVSIQNHLPDVDPFLLLDEIGSDAVADYIGGFPAHPHRGFETVTYMLEGGFQHEDHLGNVGHLQAGGVQWMTAGKGVIHSEMPMQDEGRMHGFQLWINLPAAHKMHAPRYQEIAPHQVPAVSPSATTEVRVIAGEFADVIGPINQVVTEPQYLDLRFSGEGQIDIITSPAHTALIYCYQGAVQVGQTQVNQGEMVRLSDGEFVQINSTVTAACLFLSAMKIAQPIVQHGPFVMNSKAEIHQAIKDYKAGVLTD